ncbi:MAG: dihydrofolate reductase [Clostridium sp.]|uniref:dihydrofolate reductase n=1 Tax=Clostridium sp. TaxID=1506 RepID=UPI003055BEEC
MNLIAVVDSNWGIGCHGGLLVNLPKDMAYFKEKTLNKIVVMGSKTVETFPNKTPLVNRINIVLTSRTEGFHEDFLLYHSIDPLIAALKVYPSDDVFIIGGESIYTQLLPYCHKAFITKIDGFYEADRHFPSLDKMSEWSLVESIPFMDNNIHCSFCQYDKIK